MAVNEKTIKPEWEQVETGDILLDTYIHLKTLGRIVNKDFTFRLTKLGLTRAKFCIIYQLREHFGSTTPTILSKRAYVNKHNISSAITELERDGIVQRSLNPDNHRTTIVSLTKKGIQMADRIINELRRVGHISMNVLANRDLQTFDEMMKKIKYQFLSKVLNDENKR